VSCIGAFAVIIPTRGIVILKKSAIACLFVFALVQCGCSSPVVPQKVTQQGTEENLTAWCAKHYHLPIYPGATKISFPDAQGLDQCCFSTTDDFEKVNHWYVDALSKEPWSKWELSHSADHPPGMEFYSLEDRNKAISINITRDQRAGQTNINYVDQSGEHWQKEHYKTVERKQAK
jgi:hypothetical protein